VPDPRITSGTKGPIVAPTAAMPEAAAITKITKDEGPPNGKKPHPAPEATGLPPTPWRGRYPAWAPIICGQRRCR
jgi:hypothetical protein